MEDAAVETDGDASAGEVVADGVLPAAEADQADGAGRVLMEADRIAPAEIRHRPAGRDVLAQVARDPAAPTTLIQLAANLGVG